MQRFAKCCEESGDSEVVCRGSRTSKRRGERSQEKDPDALCVVGGERRRLSVGTEEVSAWLKATTDQVRFAISTSTVSEAHVIGKVGQTTRLDAQKRATK